MSDVKRYEVHEMDPSLSQDWVRYADYEFLLQRIDALHDVVTGLRAENQRLREALEGLRSRCAAHIPIWNDQGHGLDTICVECEMMAQKAVLATPLQESGDE